MRPELKPSTRTQPPSSSNSWLELPDLEAQVLAVYADLSLEEQWEIQRRGERAGKKTWEAFAAAEDDAQAHAVLLACAALEDENASFLRSVLEKRGGR